MQGRGVDREGLEFHVIGHSFLRIHVSHFDCYLRDQKCSIDISIIIITTINIKSFPGIMSLNSQNTLGK